MADLLESLAAGCRPVQLYKPLFVFFLFLSSALALLFSIITIVEHYWHYRGPVTGNFIRWVLSLFEIQKLTNVSIL